MKSKIKNEIAIKCDCGDEMLLIADDYPFGFNLAMFTRQFDKVTWRQRLRLIWRILRHGKPYADQMCLSYKDAKELMDFISQWKKELKDA